MSEEVVIDTWLSKNTAGRMRTGITWAQKDTAERVLTYAKYSFALSLMLGAWWLLMLLPDLGVSQ